MEKMALLYLGHSCHKAFHTRKQFLAVANTLAILTSLFPFFCWNHERKFLEFHLVVLLEKKKKHNPLTSKTVVS